MEWLLPVVYLLVLAWLAWQGWRQTAAHTPDAHYYWPALLLKLACGLAIGALYIFLYQREGDSLKYQAQSEVMSRLALEDPARYLRILFTDDVDLRPLRKEMRFWYKPASFFLVKVLSVLNFFTRSSYWLNTLAFSFLSFWGSWRLFKTAAAAWPVLRLPALVALLGIPTVVFWTAGISKEAIWMGGTGLMLSALLNMAGNRNRKAVEWLILLAGLYLSWKVRYPYVALLAFVLLAWWGGRQVFRRVRRPAARWLALLALGGMLAGLAYAGRFVHPNFTVHRATELVWKSNRTILRKSAPEDRIEFDLQPSMGSLVRSSPQALLTGLFRPALWEAKHLLMLLAALENLLLLLVALGSAASFLKPWPGILPRRLPAALWVYVLVMAALLALATPNFGTLLRYRTGFLPVLVFLLLATSFWRSRFAKRIW